MNREETVALTLKRISEGKTTNEVAEELASLGVYNKRGHLADRKYVNNILLRERMNKMEGETMGRKTDGCVGQLSSGKWYYRKNYEGQMLVNKYFDKKEDAETFKREFMTEFSKGQQQTLFDSNDETKTKGGKKRGVGRPPKEKTEETPKVEKALKKKPQLQQLSQSDLSGGDGGFVVIMGKDTNVLKQILSQFEL